MREKSYLLVWWFEFESANTDFSSYFVSLISDLRTDTVDLPELVDCFLGLVGALLSADESNWTRISSLQIEQKKWFYLKVFAVL